MTTDMPTWAVWVVTLSAVGAIGSLIAGLYTLAEFAVDWWAGRERFF